ncbi:hypothetical protein OCK72_08065 [Fusobacterium simiae]|uniref:Restriction endonuclease n=1 Tax=Fusobacterium simiae TaxID=855 RepID=A0ABT4DJ09_FUSSI|nr:hypothetical protein [Fusobacterium simiae]MCY7008592.1 hypothetical protein [Fusobacterium simiae]
MNFTYQLPDNFKIWVCQFLQQFKNIEVATAFDNINYKTQDKGLAYYAGLKGDNWDKHAVDFIIEGFQGDIELLKENINTLKNAINYSLNSEESGFLLKEILFLDTENSSFFKTNKERLSADLKSAKKIYEDLIKVGEKLCLNVNYSGSSSENSINDFVRDMLSSMGYEVKDQSRHGVSTSGLEAGEVDILLTKGGNEIAIYEGMNLSCVNTTYINIHIDKAIKNYNPLGTPTYIIAYVNVVDYNDFWEKYFNHLKRYEYPFPSKIQITEKTLPNAAIKAAFIIVSRDGFDFPVYFMTFNIKK